jgi:D-alanyl-D-alanine carboxypeptidase
MSLTKKSAIFLCTGWLVLGGLGAAQAASQVAAPLSARTKAALDQEFEAMIGDSGTKVPGLGVVVYKDGKKVYSKFAGRRKISKNPAWNRPVTPDTRFWGASISKEFTGYSIMQLVEQGKLKLDEDAGKYLGFKLRNPHYPDTPITVRMLLAHTSSIRDGNESYNMPPFYRLQSFFTPGYEYWDGGSHFAPAGQAPGAYFEYCNLNYGILGTIIEKVSGQRFDLYQKNHILKQLGMKADYVPGNLGKTEFDNLGSGYRKSGAAWVAQVDDYGGKQPPANSIRTHYPFASSPLTWFNLKRYKPGNNATIFAPQGGLRISYNDLEHTLQMLLNKGKYNGSQVLRPESLQQMMTVQWRYNPANKNGDNYGGSIEAYGLSLYPLLGNSTSRPCKDYPIDLWGHTGEAYGMMTGIFMRPGTRDGFIYMLNGTAINDSSPAAAGRYSGNLVWEEQVMDTVCKNLFAPKK